MQTCVKERGVREICLSLREGGVNWESSPILYSILQPLLWSRGVLREGEESNLALKKGNKSMVDVVRVWSVKTEGDRGEDGAGREEMLDRNAEIGGMTW